MSCYLLLTLTFAVHKFETKTISDHKNGKEDTPSHCEHCVHIVRLSPDSVQKETTTYQFIPLHEEQPPPEAEVEDTSVNEVSEAPPAENEFIEVATTATPTEEETPTSEEDCTKSPATDAPDEAKSSCDRAKEKMQLYDVKEMTAYFVDDACVKVLVIEADEINSIAEDALAGVPNLHTLELHNSYKLNAQQLFGFGCHEKFQKLSIYMQKPNEVEDPQTIEVPCRLPKFEILLARQINLAAIGKSWQTNLPNLQYLDVSENPIDIKNFFVNLPNSLKTLLIKSAGINQLGSGYCAWLKNIIAINLSRNNFTRISSDPDTTNPGDLNLFYPKPKRLHALTISECGIERIDDNAFEHIRELKVIEIAFNRLTEIPQSALAHWSELIHLNISGNKLLNLPDFSKLPKLEALYLNAMKNACLFNTSDIGIWRLRNLKELSIANNKLESLPKGFFNNMPNLRELNVMNNKIKKLDLRILPLIKRLNIANTKVTFKSMNVHENIVFEELCMGNIKENCKPIVWSFCPSGFTDNSTNYDEYRRGPKKPCD